MVIDTLITNRTDTDLKEWERLYSAGLSGMTTAEKNRWRTTSLRGAYNASDMNRVANAYNYLAGLMRLFGKIPSYTALKNNWTAGDIPTASDLDACTGSIEALKVASGASGFMPESMGMLTVDGANAIEQTLININGKLKKIEASLEFAGDIYAGEA